MSNNAIQAAAPIAATILLFASATLSSIVAPILHPGDSSSSLTMHFRFATPSSTSGRSSSRSFFRFADDRGGAFLRSVVGVAADDWPLRGDEVTGAYEVDAFGGVEVASTAREVWAATPAE